MLQSSITHAKDDILNRQLSEAIINAESLIKSISQAITTDEDLLPANEINQIKNKLAELKNTINKNLEISTKTKLIHTLNNELNSLTQDLSTYINNTQDGVTFDQISEFVLNYELPTVNNSDLTTVLGQLQAPTGSPTPANPNPSQPATTDTWWGGLINGLAPAVSQLVDKVKDPSEIAGLAALDKYNNDVF